MYIEDRRRFFRILGMFLIQYQMHSWGKKRFEEMKKDE